MKKKLIIILTICSLKSFGQADTLELIKLNDFEWTRKYSNSTQFKYIKFEDGSVLKVGDKMRFGIPSGSIQSAEISGSRSTRSSNFSYIMLGRMFSIFMSGGVTYLPESFKGREAVIENIKISKSNKKSRPSTAFIFFQNPGSDITVFDVKFALDYGELINPKAAITSDEALSQLKKAKEKLDLGLISQNQFDSLRKVFSKFIN